MTEFVRTAPDLVALHWAEGGSPEMILEPDESLKEDGYAEEDLPANDHWNWREREIGRLAAWLAGATVRRFAYLGDALTTIADVTDVPDGAEFAVGVTPQADLYLREDVMDPDPDGGTITHVACDGARIFVAGIDSTAAKFLSAWHRVAGTWTQSWTITPAAAVTHVCCDGARVFYGLARSGSANVYMVNALTGAAITNATLPGARVPGRLACNGQTLAINSYDATNVSLLEYTYTASAITSGVETVFGLIATPAIIRDMAIIRYVDATGIDADTVVVVVGKNGGVGTNDFLQIIGGGVLMKAVASAGIEGHGVKSDGRRLFIAHDSYEVVTGSTVDSYCHCRSLTGEKVLWYGPASGGSAAAQGLAFDGHRLYVGVGAKLAAGSLKIFRVDASHGGVIDREYSLADLEILGACDGTQLVCQDRSGGATDDDICVVPVIHGSRRFIRTASTDINRTPGFALAQPAE